VEDLVHRGREIERSVLALGALAGAVDLEDRRPVEGNRLACLRVGWPNEPLSRVRRSFAGAGL
jgi:hypothetical protein